MHKAATLRAQAHELIWDRISGVADHSLALEALVNELFKVDNEVAEWAVALPTQWDGLEFRVKDLDPQDPRIEVLKAQDFFDSIMVYPICAASVARSHQRCLRILINRSIRDVLVCLARIDGLEEIIAKESELIMETCRSVMPFLNSVTSLSTDVFSNEGLGGMRGLLIMWPLRTALSGSELTLPLIPTNQRKFLNGVLTYLYRYQGVPQAKIFVKPDI